MPIPCPETIPFYYTTTLHVIATVSIPVNLIGFYLVWFQSPGMQKYKFCLIYMQMATFLTEIHMSWICPGYYFFPMVGGYNTGEFFGQFISSHLSMSIWVGVFCFELAAGLMCFVYRHNAAAMIQHNYSQTMYLEKISLVLTHIFPFFTGASLYMSKLTYEQKYDYVRKNFPQCIFWMQFPGFEVYDYHMNPWLAITGIGAFAWVFIIAWYCFFLGVHTMIILQRLRHHMSSQTYQMHRQALISLVMQLVIPGVLIIVPLDFCMFTVITENTDMQEIATDSMFLIGSHSVCQCTVMILTNQRYRRVLRERAWAILNSALFSDTLSKSHTPSSLSSPATLSTSRALSSSTTTGAELSISTRLTDLLGLVEMTVIYQLNPFGHCTIAFYVSCFIIGLLFSRFATWLSRRIRTNYPRKFRFQQKLKNLYKVKCAEFTLICGPNRTERYAKKADLKQMDEFLRKIFPNHTNKLPGNLVSVWIPRTNFKTGKSFQQFEPSGGVAPGSWFCYRMVCDRVQETLYCVDGKRYMAGICIYMRMPDEWWWWAPTIERDTVENAFRKGPQYTPKQENQLVQVAPPKYEDIEKEPPSYTSLLIEKE